MSAQRLTERQYVELRSYEHGMPSWRPHASNARSRLIEYGLLRRGRDEFFQITAGGLAALTEFRTKHGLPVGV